MKNILALLAVLLLAGSAQAAAFKDCETGTAKGSITTGKELCADFLTADLKSDLLSVGKCTGGFTVIYNSDSTGVAITSTLQVMTCVHPTADVNACTPIDGVTLDGVITTDLGEMYGAKAQWIYLQAITDPVTDEPRAMVLCHG